MVKGQRLPYPNRRPFDLNATDLRRRLEQVRDKQRRACFTLQQETRQALQAAEGRPRDWDSENQRGGDERRRGFWARMGPSPPREEATGRWDIMPSLGTRRAQAKTAVDRDTIHPISQGMHCPQDFSGNVLPPTVQVPPVTIFRRILEYPPPFVSNAVPPGRSEEEMRIGTGSSGDGSMDGFPARASGGPPLGSCRPPPPSRQTPPGRPTKISALPPHPPRL